ncbi:MAG: NADPH-dependent glutamate synthase [Actinomycetota bacterium]|nr:NADPH-dependent glutamate synthase [Actinomycetota bacterium]
MIKVSLRAMNKLDRTDMPARDPLERAACFDEVNMGLTPEQATVEAMRCLQCKTPTCIDGCPVNIQIDQFIDRVAHGDIRGAGDIIRMDSLLPAICGRVCPQESQCEGTCVLDKKHRPIAIGHLERYVADTVRRYGLEPVAEPIEPSGKSVAIVGSGPAGLACAADLAKAGHHVRVFEALHQPGGVLIYGIPEFRLPKDIVAAEIDGLKELGVEFEMNAIIGRTITVEELFDEEGFDAVFVGVGAGLPRFLGVEGENLIGVYSANEFLTRVNLMGAYREDTETPVLDLTGRRVVVFGGGNTAMDSARTPLRLGAKEVRVAYRRTEAEMPARDEEIEHAKEEGIIFDFLVSPVELLGNDEGWLTGVRFQRMELGEPDDSGRRRPVPIEGDIFDLDADVVIVAIGNSPNPLLPATESRLEQTRWGTLAVDETTGRTTMPGVFAGGDIVTGGATVILAMGAGRVAAASINEYLETGVWEEAPEAELEPAEV